VLATSVIPGPTTFKNGPDLPPIFSPGIVKDSSEEYRRLGRSGIPVLLMWGRFDRDVPLEVSKRIMADVPQVASYAARGGMISKTG
jgi:pimeloyl-ACP methyl ester carboxylesterase